MRNSQMIWKMTSVQVLKIEVVQLASGKVRRKIEEKVPKKLADTQCESNINTVALLNNLSPQLPISLEHIKEKASKDLMVYCYNISKHCWLNS